MAVGEAGFGARRRRVCVQNRTQPFGKCDGPGVVGGDVAAGAGPAQIAEHMGDGGLCGISQYAKALATDFL